MHVLSARIAQAFVFEVYENRFQLWEQWSKKLQSYFHHSRGPTENQLLSGVGRIFKALWDQSEYPKPTECIYVYRLFEFFEGSQSLYQKVYHKVYYKVCIQSQQRQNLYKKPTESIGSIEPPNKLLLMRGVDPVYTLLYDMYHELQTKFLSDFNPFVWARVHMRWFSVEGFDTRCIPRKFSRGKPTLCVGF